jgi:hypothetical protein
MTRGSVDNSYPLDDPGLLESKYVLLLRYLTVCCPSSVLSPLTPYDRIVHSKPAGEQTGLKLPFRTTTTEVLIFRLG